MIRATVILAGLLLPVPASATEQLACGVLNDVVHLDLLRRAGSPGYPEEVARLYVAGECVAVLDGDRVQPVGKPGRYFLARTRGGTYWLVSPPLPLP